jgi:CcmD family protein
MKKLMVVSVILISLALLHPVKSLIAVSEKPAVPAAGEKAAVKSDDGSAANGVMAVVLISWLGIAGYLFVIDRKIEKLEKRISG